MTLLQDKIAIVTGGTRGIGKAIAHAFASEGATTYICGRKEAGVQAAASDLAGLPGAVYGVPCHVGRLDDLQALVARVEREQGRIDILVNNAATNIAQGPCLSFDDTQFDKMVEVNLKSAYRLIRLSAPGMCSRGSGSILNISSIAGVQPQFESLLYSMTKAALIMMTKSYALEFGPSGVRVNAIAPGLVETALSEYFWKDEARRNAIIGRQPIRHLAKPEEIAGIAVMLVSGQSSYLTGQTVIVDGGATLA